MNIGPSKPHKDSWLSFTFKFKIGPKFGVGLDFSILLVQLGHEATTKHHFESLSLLLDSHPERLQ